MRTHIQQRVWQFGCGKRHRGEYVRCPGSGSRLRWETRATRREKKTNQRKINDFQQNLLSINLSSEAVVDVAAAAATAATAYLVQNLN